MDNPTPELPAGGPPPSIETPGGRAGIDNTPNDIFFAAVETTRMPMTVTDPNQPDNPIIFANNAFINMTGYTREEIVGRNCRFLQGPETDMSVIDQVREAIRTETEFATEVLNYRKNGSTFWNALFVSPVYGKDGKLLYFFGSQLDVSRRRDAEDALRQSQKMEALGQLTGGIAHDFNNLLQVIVGYMDSLTYQAEKVGDARTVRQLEAVSDAAGRATKLTQQLLAFSRKQRLEGRALSLNSLVESMAELAQRTLGASIEFRTELADGLWNSRLDPVQAEMALLNIVINARDAMPDGGSVTLSTANRVLENSEDTPRALPPGRYVEVAVADTGSGIPPEVLGRVMDPFFTTKEEGKGTGLGLSSVYGFARQSGGAAEIDSEVGKGTTVRLLFPVTEQEAKTHAPSNRAMDRGGAETILVVDDRPELAELARSILEDAGYAVLTAANGRSALEVLDGRPEVDMLFSDLIMPGGMNGVVLAREAKRRRPKLRVLLTTGYAEASLERDDAGGTEFELIDKPYRRADLVRRVRLVLDGPTGVG